MCTAEKFVRCCYNISNSDYYWKDIDLYLSRSSSGRGYFVSPNTEDETIRKHMRTAEKFVRCCYNMSNSDYYWKDIDLYLSRSSSSMGYFVSQNTEDETIRKHTRTAEKFVKCCYNISNSDYYWKDIYSYLSRSSSGMRYFISQNTEDVIIGKRMRKAEKFVKWCYSISNSDY